MFSKVNHILDRVAMDLATKTVPPPAGPHSSAGRVLELLEDPAWWHLPASVAEDLVVSEGREFRFSSPVRSGWRRNDIVPGRWHPAGESKGGAVILLHGWNGEYCYRYLFPILARFLNRRGIASAMFELPFHGARRPERGQTRRNFITRDPVEVLGAARQAMADAAGMAGWLRQRGYRSIGLWGFSLGGWLAGLLSTMGDPAHDVAVLTTPIVSMAHTVAELPFCAGLRSSMSEAQTPFKSLELVSRENQLQPGNILLVGGRDDLFVPWATVEELSARWKGSELWRVARGHITVLVSMELARRTVRWIASRMN